MSKSHSELFSTIRRELLELRRSPTDVASIVGNFYQPDPRLAAKLQEVQAALDGTSAPTTTRGFGNLLEQAAMLLFLGCQGTFEYQSFRSQAAEYDLLISGAMLDWPHLALLLGLPAGRTRILVECKNKKPTKSTKRPKATLPEIATLRGLRIRKQRQTLCAGRLSALLCPAVVDVLARGRART